MPHAPDIAEEDRQRIYERWLDCLGDTRCVAREEGVSVAVVSAVVTKELHRRRRLTDTARAAIYANGKPT